MSTSVVLMKRQRMHYASTVLQEVSHQINMKRDVGTNEKRVVEVRTVELVQELSEVYEFSTELLRRHWSEIVVNPPQVRFIS